jgi:hypothetical protein
MAENTYILLGPFTVRGLVAQTIEIAMDEKTLAEM